MRFPNYATIKAIKQERKIKMETFISSVLRDFYEAHKVRASVDWNQQTNVLTVYQHGQEITYQHCPELEKVFFELEPKNEYAMVKFTCKGNVCPQEHWLYVQKGKVVERLEFAVHIQGYLECRRMSISGHRKRFPSSIEKIQLLFQKMMEEHRDYRLHVITSPIRHYHL